MLGNQALPSISGHTKIALAKTDCLSISKAFEINGHGGEEVKAVPIVQAVVECIDRDNLEIGTRGHVQPATVVEVRSKEVDLWVDTPPSEECPENPGR